MAIGCGAKCAKIILVIFNFVFWLSGAAILGVGVWLLADPTIVKYMEVIQMSADDPYLKTASYILIGVGAFIFIVGFFGCCGAIKESKCMLGLYLFFLIIVMAGELGAGILVAVYKSEIEAQLKKGMKKQVEEKYRSGANTSKSFDDIWDFTQYDRKCCGAMGPADYKNSTFKNKSKLSVPESCCVMAATSTEDKMKPEDLNQCRADATTIQNTGTIPANAKIHTAGCYEKIVDWFSMYATILIGVACGIAALEIFGFVFAVCLCRNLGDVED